MSAEFDLSADTLTEADRMAMGLGTSPAATPVREPFPIYMVTVLALVSFFNSMDRMVLAALLQPIKDELRLNDTELGLLSGLAFAAFYAILGIPLARLADRASRVKLIAACLGVWSLMTALTGLARSFPQLFLARMGVGVGEAGCLPTSHSLIADLLTPERRALGVCIFQAGALAGASIGLMVTGALADHLGWRVALLVTGSSGLPLALLILLTFREPRRRRGEKTTGEESAWTAIAALLRRRGYVNLALALSVGGFGMYAIQQWLPTFYLRSFGLSLTEVALWTGAVTGIGGVTGVLAGGVLATWLVRRDRRWELWLPAIVYGTSAALYVAVFLSRSAFVAYSMNALASFLIGGGGGVALSAIQSFAEPHRRATAFSLTFLMTSLIGLGFGPLLVGAGSEFLEPMLGRESLRYALLAASLSMGWAALLFLKASRHTSPNHTPGMNSGAPGDAATAAPGPR